MTAERFELLEELGRGGMGVVWKARDRTNGQIVAMKLLHEMYVSDPDYIARFEREVDIARKINSPNVVKVLGYGKFDGRPYVAMEYVAGKSLRDLLRERGKLEWVDARRLFGQLLTGLEAAHAAGVLHRDIKPGNLLIDETGRLKVTDFGISRAADLTRMTGSATVLGTPTYMAPEGQLDERSELYSAGCVLFEMLTGSPPFVGDTMHSVILKHIREAPDLSLLPPEARALVGALLDKDPAARPLGRAEEALLFGGIHAGSAASPEESVACSDGLAPLPTPKRRFSEVAKLSSYTQSKVIAAAFAGDTQSLMVAYLDGRIVLWNTDKGTPLSIKSDYGLGATCFAVSTTAQLVAAGRGDGTTVIWHLPSFIEAGFLMGRASGLVAALDFSADGKRLVSGSWDGVVQAWKLDGLREAGSRKHARIVPTNSRVLQTKDLRVARFERDQDEVLVADSRRMWRWRAYSGGVLEEIGDAGATAMDIASDGTVLTADPSNTVLIRSGSRLNPTEAVRSPGPVGSVAFAADERTYAYTSNKTVFVRSNPNSSSSAGGELSAILHDTEVRIVAFAPQGQRLATVDDEGVTRIWDRVE